MKERARPPGSPGRRPGTPVSTVVGEGPIDAINNVYNNQVVGSWNGFGYFSLFEERLTGQISLK